MLHRHLFSRMDPSTQNTSPRTSDTPGQVSTQAGSDASSRSREASAACPPDQFRDLLAREVLRDERLLALEQEVRELRDLVRVLARSPVHEQPTDNGCDEESTLLSESRVLRLDGQAEGECASARSHVEIAEGAEEDVRTEWVPPPTMYAYCSFHISKSDNPLKLRETRLLILMLACQVTLVFSFSISDALNSAKKHMKKFYDATVMDDECLYWPMVFHHRPLLFVASVVCIMVVVLCFLKAKDRDTMMTLHTEPRTISGRWLINYAWFIQAIWLPCMFCGCTANLLWSHENARTAVMDSVSLAFLLEIDRHMFTALVSEERKAAYKEELSSMHKDVDFAAIHTAIHRAEWLLYHAGIAQCVVMSMWLHYLNYFNILAESYSWCLIGSSCVYVAGYFVRASLMWIQRPHRSTDESLSTTGWPVTLSALGLSHFTALCLVWVPKSLLPPLTVSCFEQFLT